MRRQLALYLGRDSKPRRIDAATRVSLAWLSRLFQWGSALVVVRPQTLIRWSTFLKNHARAIVACDFFVTVTSTFRLLYVLAVIEHRSRKVDSL